MATSFDIELFLQITAGCKSTSLRSKAIGRTGNANTLTFRPDPICSSPNESIEETNAIELNGAQVFSKIDIKDSFHQNELDEESKYITVLSTHIGLFEYERLNMGICSATDIFQNTL